MQYQVVLSSGCAACSAFNAVRTEGCSRLVNIDSIGIHAAYQIGIVSTHPHTPTHTYTRVRVGRSGKAAARAIECTPTLYGAVCTESMHSVGARDRPHPRRSNNKIIITKSSDRIKG